ncbi:MAG: hypothetical protein H6613_08765 [Ignavibacteriales bacterium]|nr:hypothetical protein [Ignavibacteriales bacterium]
MLCTYHEMLSIDAGNKIFYNQPYNLLTDQSQRALNQMVNFIYKYKFSPVEVTNFDGFSAYMYGYNHDAVF